METIERDGDEWVITGESIGILVFTTQRTTIYLPAHQVNQGKEMELRASSSQQTYFQVEEFMWTFNMPTDHAHVTLTQVRVSDEDILGEEGMGLQTAQLFVHENRTATASSLGAGLHCIDTAVDWLEIESFSGNHSRKPSTSFRLQNFIPKRK